MAARPCGFESRSRHNNAGACRLIFSPPLRTFATQQSRNGAAKHITPFTDCGFMRTFGQEANKTPLPDFLNNLHQGERRGIPTSREKKIGASGLDPIGAQGL